MIRQNLGNEITRCLTNPYGKLVPLAKLEISGFPEFFNVPQCP